MLFFFCFFFCFPSVFVLLVERQEGYLTSESLAATEASKSWLSETGLTPGVTPEEWADETNQVFFKPPPPVGADGGYGRPSVPPSMRPSMRPWFTW